MPEIPGDTGMDVEFPIENVPQETWRRLKERPILFGCASILLIFFGVSWTYGYFAEKVLWNFLGAIGLMSSFIIFVRISVKVHQEFMRHFAEVNGYTYQAQTDPEFVLNRIGSMFQTGDSKAASHMISGFYLEHPLKIFNYRFMVGSGKQRHGVENTILEIDLDSNLPNIFLVSGWFLTQVWLPIRSSLSTLKFTSQPKPVEIGGGFDSKFKLYAPEDYEMEALQIFEYGVMESLAGYLDALGGYALEFIENKLYIYIPGTIGTGRQLRGAYELAKFVIQKMNPSLKGMKPMLDAQEEVLTKLNNS